MPTDTKTVSLITQACQTLAGNWTVRNTKMLDWHNILILENTLKQEDMESVISNDPRTGYNLALHLLTSSTVSHRIPIEGLSVSDVGKASYLESWVTKQWVGINENYRRRGRQGWLRDLVALMLSTGWFSVFSCVTDDSVISELWHPSTVYQEFGDDLLQVAHIYDISTTAANRKMKLMGWKGQPFKTGSAVTVYDWWFYDSDGDVSNGVVMGNQLMKSPVKETDYSRLPVFTGPVSGLPESGTLVKGNAWQEHFGEAIVATNENLQANYNKMLTFMQQMVRDTAQARWLELSNGENGILRQEDMFKRGAIFRGSPGEDARPLPVPPIPVELRTMMFDYQNMLQRGMFPWVLYGNLQMQLTGVAMSQIASAALQVLTPYQLAIKGLLTDIDNFWMSTIKDTGARPAGFKMPKELKEIPLFDVDFNIDIPGFLVQRATAARMLDPNFKLSTTTVMDMLFPEVKNPLLEQARSQKDRADQHEVSVLIAMIRSYQEAAKMARDDNDSQTADLYDKVVVALEAQITAMGPKAGGQAGAISMPPERSEGRAMNVAQQEIPATEELGSQPPQGGV